MQISLTGNLLDGSGTSFTTTARQDLTFAQGVDVTFLITVNAQNGTPKNITGYTGRMTWRFAQNQTSPAPLVLPLTLTSPTGGQGTFALPAATSKGFNQSLWWYDVFIVSGSNASDEVIPTSLITLNVAVGM